MGSVQRVACPYRPFLIACDGLSSTFTACYGYPAPRFLCSVRHRHRVLCVQCHTNARYAVSHPEAPGGVSETKIVSGGTSQREESR